MSTELSKFSEAYATMTVATYEPLILKWISGVAICNLAGTLTTRLNKENRNLGTKTTSQFLSLARASKALPDLKSINLGGKEPAVNFMSNTNFVVDEKLVKKVEIKGYPNAVSINGKIHLNGYVDQDLRDGKTRHEPSVPLSGIKQVPIAMNRNYGRNHLGEEIERSFKKTYAGMIKAVETAISSNENVFMHLDKAVKNMGNLAGYHFFPGKIEEALSPIGIAHYFRQFYFNVEEGVGPIEQAFTVAPLETLEVVYQTVMRSIFEETVETGIETVSESMTEEKNLEEISDKVSSMIQRDSSASMSANASGSIGVWQVGASASGSFSNSSQRSREETSRRLKETTKRASERITKSFSIRTRETRDFTTSNYQRRVIQNNSPAPVSYGLRRVLRKVLVKVQDLGPRLVWQLYVPNPGEGLARSKFIHFRESDPIAVPDVPPGVRPRPQGGTEVGSTSSVVSYDGGRGTYFVTVVISTGSDRQITAVSIDNITDLEGGGKNDYAPSPKNTEQWGASFNTATHTYSVNIAILPGDAESVTVNYTYSWMPSAETMAAWEAEVAAARAVLQQAALNEQFEKQKTLITQKSKIMPRPANDLRKEERYEVMNRMISMLFAQGIDDSQPAPLEIEYFHKYFDIDGMFVYNHPSWWRPRYTNGGTGLGRPHYEITAESDPAKLGSSLGWLMQLDGDSRRNEFLNSPWVRVCLPIKPGVEEQSIAWLARHIEGEYGYNTSSGPLKNLLAYVKEFRNRENQLGVNGPNYVTVDSTVGAPADPQVPQSVFPIIEEFEVVLPTEGFVYDELILNL